MYAEGFKGRCPGGPGKQGAVGSSVSDQAEERKEGRGEESVLSDPT